MQSIKIFVSPPLQLVHVPPVQLGLSSLHSLIKEHSLQASSLDRGAKAGPGLDDDIEDEADISVYGKEVRKQGGSDALASAFAFFMLPSGWTCAF